MSLEAWPFKKTFNKCLYTSITIPKFFYKLVPGHGRGGSFGKESNLRKKTRTYTFGKTDDFATHEEGHAVHRRQGRAPHNKHI